MIDLRPYCIGFWKMNDNLPNTVVVDDSGGEHNGTAQQNTEDLHVTGKLNGALTFNGSSDYIIVPDDAVWDVGGKLTVCQWFRSLDDTHDLPMLLHDSSNYKYYLYSMNAPDNDVVRFEVKTASGYYLAQAIFAEGSIRDGNWHFAVGIYDKTITGSEGKRLILYVDNVYVADSYVLPNEDIVSGDEGIHIGRYGSNYFYGDIDATFLFNTRLTGDEIAWLWNQGNGSESLHEFQVSCSIKASAGLNASVKNAVA